MVLAILSLGAQSTGSTELLMGARNGLEAYVKEHGFETVGASSDIASGLTM